MKHKIIVTGGCGFIGSHTVIELLENDYEVVIIDDLSNSSEETIHRIQKITGLKPQFVNIDLKDTLQTKKIIKEHKDAKAVIHFAAHKAVNESVKDPLKYYENNLFSLVNILKAQIEFGIPNFIFSSSATVYGASKELPITEKTKVQRPFSPYGNTKKIAEEILEELVDSNQHLGIISLRYFNPVGAHKSGLIGELPSDIPNNLMPYITQTAAGVREKLMIFGDDYPTKDGTPIRDYIHVEDLAKAHLAALKRLIDQEQEQQFEIFNLGTGTGYSVLEVVKTFEEVSNTILNYEITERRLGDVTELYAATDLAKEKLGWTATKSLKEMIRSSWKWEQYVREGEEK